VIRHHYQKYITRSRSPFTSLSRLRVIFSSYLKQNSFATDVQFGFFNVLYVQLVIFVAHLGMIFFNKSTKIKNKEEVFG